MIEVAARPLEEKHGLYRAEVWSKIDGEYLCDVQAITPDGNQLQTVSSGWVAQPKAAEFQNLKRYEKQLKELAETSGGKLVSIDELEAFAENIPGSQVPITEWHSTPLWHRPWLIILAMAALCGEWAIRRWNGFA